MPGQRIGYVRVSSVDQHPDRQLDGLDVDRIFTDRASGKDTQRPQLAALLQFARDGDTVVVHSVDRLARWVNDGVELPPSSFPRIADGTAVRGGEALARFRDIPGVTVPDTEKLPAARRIDLGPDAERGVGRFPAALGDPYPNLVSAVDDDGNESGGIRMPAVAEPVATYTGWNPRDPTTTGGARQIINMQGSTLPFPSTPQERKRTGDPRRSIAERYRDRDDYLARARVVAGDLAGRRYILDEDIDLAAELAAERYDAFAPAPEAVTGG
jgi:hypothetical protein